MLQQKLAPGDPPKAVHALACNTALLHNLPALHHLNCVRYPVQLMQSVAFLKSKIQPIRKVPFNLRSDTHMAFARPWCTPMTQICKEETPHPLGFPAQSGSM